MPKLLTRDQGRTRVLTLHRPEVRNALDRELREELMRALDEAEELSAVRSVIVTGSGAAFCAGMDLAELEAMLGVDFKEHLTDSRELGALFRRLYEYPKPVVAAVNGHAIAGGAGLATVCDLVVMSEDAKLGYTEVRIGFVAALVGVYLTRLAGERVARELLLLGRPLTAREIHGRRLVNEVVSSERVLPRALELAESLAHNSPQAIAATKKLLYETSGLPLDAALDLAAEVNASARSSEDMREGVRAFLEKREPGWREAGS